MAIEGRVAELLNTRELAINIGKNLGVQKGMKFKVLAAEPILIKDPDTQEELGEFDREKVRVEVTEVYDNFSVCKTYRKIYYGNAYLAKTISEMLVTSGSKIETLKADDTEFPPDLSEAESYIKKGDRVIQVLDD